MARKRLLGQKFFTNGALFDAELASGLPLRLAYASLWPQTERRGLFEWRPRELKLACLPYDSLDFARILDALEAFGFVQRFVSADGDVIGFLPHFVKEQGSFNVLEKPDAHIPELARMTRQYGAGTVAEHSETLANGSRTTGTGSGTGPMSGPKHTARNDKNTATALPPSAPARVAPSALAAPQSHSKKRGGAPRKYPPVPPALLHVALEAWHEHVGPVDAIRLSVALSRLLRDEPAVRAEDVVRVIAAAPANFASRRCRALPSHVLGYYWHSDLAAVRAAS